MVTGPAGPEIKNDYAGEAQQQITIPYLLQVLLKHLSG
jgi:hypothetical protein